jgi:hypothetical protein
MERPSRLGGMVFAPPGSGWSRAPSETGWRVVRDSGKVGVRMPEKKHLRGVGEKEQRMYEHIKEDAKKEGRYGKRAEEVAARTVMKHHKEEGHKKGR